MMAFIFIGFGVMRKLYNEINKDLHYCLDVQILPQIDFRLRYDLWAKMRTDLYEGMSSLEGVVLILWEQK